ncbi:MAG TPA: hypothetical protein VG815_11410 [Chloroflexota bacterium]|nr:hypothetical protein [Chloroflexota bacterium]
MYPSGRGWDTWYASRSVGNTSIAAATPARDNFLPDFAHFLNLRSIACPPDCNLLFAVLALQADCVTRAQFIEACTLWAADKTTAIDALMVQRGWLTPEDRVDVQRLVERKLKKHAGNVRKSLAEAAGEDVRQSLAACLPADFVGLATLPPPSPLSSRSKGAAHAHFLLPSLLTIV